jgi:histone-binding protein RBBP4
MKRPLEDVTNKPDDSDDSSSCCSDSDEYKIWKKNSPLLYDFVFTHCFTWPSLTAEYIPNSNRLITGTQTSDGSDNQLNIINLKSDQCQVISSMAHPGEVNRALHKPQNPFVIATKTSKADILLFDYSKFGATPTKDSSAVGDDSFLTLKGHDNEGFALCWSKLDDGTLASGAEDSKILVFETGSGSNQPSVEWADSHEGTVESVNFHSKNRGILISCGTDKKLKVWDVRQKHVTTSLDDAHKDEINAVEFCPFNEFLVGSGGSDKVVNLFDTRKFTRPIYSLEGGHMEDITNVKWSPFSECILASSGNDRKVCLWDLSRIGDEIVNEDLADGPPELMFVHGGHTGRINDFSWSSVEGGAPTIASVADDNILQVWTPAKSILAEDEEI